MIQEYIVSAVGGNRPGVVAEVTEAIYLSGCNIENSSMTLVGNHFTLMIHIFIEAEDVYRDLSHRCQELQRNKELKIYMFPVESGKLEPAADQEPKPRYGINVRGQDQAGIVYRTSKLLASRNINILELSTSVDRSAGREYPLFTMSMEVEVPKEMNGEALRTDLEYLAEHLQESITLTRR